MGLVRLGASMRGQQRELLVASPTLEHAPFLSNLTALHFLFFLFVFPPRKRTPTLPGTWISSPTMAQPKG